jgi:diaminopimelate decarboxylase/aspartate kinase
VTYIGLDAGMHTLIRPALYGAYHRILNLSRLGEDEIMTANIVGPICETGDILGRGRRVPPTEEGDIFLIASAGAYGSAMSSEYNLRERPREVSLDR